MHDPLSVLELRQAELFERIVRRLGESANVDVDDAMIRGFLAEAAEALIGHPLAQPSDPTFVLKNDPVLAGLVSAYDDVTRSIADLLVGEAGTEWASDPGPDEVADLAGGLAASREWSDDR